MDETVGGIYVEEEVSAGNLGIVVVQVKCK